MVFDFSSERNKDCSFTSKNNLGVALLIKGDVGEAINQLKQASDDAKGGLNQSVHVNLGIAYLRAGKLLHAKNELMIACEKTLKGFDAEVAEECRKYLEDTDYIKNCELTIGDVRGELILAAPKTTKKTGETTGAYSPLLLQQRKKEVFEGARQFMDQIHLSMSSGGVQKITDVSSGKVVRVEAWEYEAWTYCRKHGCDYEITYTNPADDSALTYFSKNQHLMGPVKKVTSCGKTHWVRIDGSVYPENDGVISQTALGECNCFITKMREKAEVRNIMNALNKCRRTGVMNHASYTNSSCDTYSETSHDWRFKEEETTKKVFEAEITIEGEKTSSHQSTEPILLH